MYSCKKIELCSQLHGKLSMRITWNWCVHRLIIVAVSSGSMAKDVDVRYRGPWFEPW